MAQVTLYLDEATALRVREAARAAGMTQSRWVSAIIRNRLATQWPPDVAALAGAWRDAPTAEDLRTSEAHDAARESL